MLVRVQNFSVSCPSLARVTRRARLASRRPKPLHSQAVARKTLRQSEQRVTSNAHFVCQVRPPLPLVDWRSVTDTDLRASLTPLFKIAATLVAGPKQPRHRPMPVNLLAPSAPALAGGAAVETPPEGVERRHLQVRLHAIQAEVRPGLVRLCSSWRVRTGPGSHGPPCARLVHSLVAARLSTSACPPPVSTPNYHPMDHHQPSRHSFNHFAVRPDWS